jgi:hypothetical protein
MRLLLLSAMTVGLSVPGPVPSPAAAPTRPAGSNAAPAQDYAFPSGAGLLFFYVHPDKTTDFEAVIGRLSELLERSDDPIRKAQAASWKIFRSLESTGPSVIYIFFFDPAVAGADYDPVKVLGEAPASEVQALYARLKAAIIRVERMGLSTIR